jgi:hypothetical protein
VKYPHVEVAEEDEPPICWCGQHYVGADCPTPAREPSVVADELRHLSYAKLLQGFDDHPDRLLREAAYLLSTAPQLKITDIEIAGLGIKQVIAAISFARSKGWREDR